MRTDSVVGKRKKYSAEFKAKVLGITGKPVSKDNKSLEPMEGHGLQAMSIGFMIDVDSPMVWRGPMVMSALA